MMDNLRHSAMQVFTILFRFHKLHGLYYETQQFRVKETLRMVASRKDEAIVKFE